MAARSSSRILLNSAWIALALALAYPAAMSCTPEARSIQQGRHSLHADGTPADKGKVDPERCKKSDGTRGPSKECPDGGERLPQDKRSPFDTIPPLSPLVA